MEIKWIILSILHLSFFRYSLKCSCVETDLYTSQKVKRAEQNFDIGV